jgi:hypothetical protein
MLFNVELFLLLGINLYFFKKNELKQWVFFYALVRLGGPQLASLMLAWKTRVLFSSLLSGTQ